MFVFLCDGRAHPTSSSFSEKFSVLSKLKKPSCHEAVTEHDRALRSFDVKIQSLLDPVRKRLAGAEESVKSLFVSMTDNSDENRENIQALQTCVEKSAQATEAIINSLQISRDDGTSGMAASINALESALEDSMEATERTERGLKNVEVHQKTNAQVFGTP